MAAVRFQSWMTFFTCVFSFLCITEIHDSFLRNILVRKDENLENRRAHQHNRLDEANEEFECDARLCLYEFIFCGGLRQCLFFVDYSLGNEEEALRKRSKCSILAFSMITLVFAFFMEVSHYEFFSNVSVIF